MSSRTYVLRFIFVTAIVLLGQRPLSIWGAESTPPEFRLDNEKITWDSPPKMIDGHVLMRKLRLKPGPLIGKLLDAVRDAQAEGKVHNLDEAIDYARKVLGAES